MTKEGFREFVKTKPSLASYVNNGKMTWQKFYEMYDLYGEDNDIWKQYNNNYQREKVATTAASEVGFKQIFNTLKGMDLTQVQNGITSIQKGIDVLQDLFSKGKGTSTRDTYEPRPMYKYFDD